VKALDPDLKRPSRRLYESRPSCRRSACATQVTVSMPAAGGTPENAEFGTMRMVEVDNIASSRQRPADIEFRAVGQQRAGHDGRMRRALVFDDHTGSGAHHICRRLVENAPACFGDLRDVSFAFISGKIISATGRRVRRRAREQSGETLSQRSFRLARQISAGDIE
jgi:hypothetical protein